jgi:putative NIF3 family GTP cyclohydrolase 1 type 2
MIASELLSFWQVNRLLPLADDEGFRFGRTDTEVSGMQVCWKPTVDAIEHAAACGCNLIVTHEELNFPPAYAGADFETGLCGATARRVKSLARHHITVFRAHSSLDRFCVLDAFAQTLGLANPRMGGDDYAQRVYDIPPVPFRELCGRVSRCMDLPALRVRGDPDKEIRRVGLPWGGVGISANANFVQDFIRLSADALIGGECEELPFLAARDAGVCYIETGHAASENPGLRFAAQRLEAHFGIPVAFYACGQPWTLLEAL